MMPTTLQHPSQIGLNEQRSRVELAQASAHHRQSRAQALLGRCQFPGSNLDSRQARHRFSNEVMIVAAQPTGIGNRRLPRLDRQIMVPQLRLGLGKIENDLPVVGAQRRNMIVALMLLECRCQQRYGLLRIGIEQ